MIDANNLHKYYKSFHALKGIDLHVNQGEIYGFIGHNGAGKTTTLNILAGLSRPSAGTCMVNGRDVASVKRPGELGIGYLPEEPSFYPWLTAYETLEYLGSGSEGRPPKRRIEQMLHWVGLANAASRRVGGFSRGMRQRLGIGAALIRDAQILLLDEPSSALDPQGRNEVLNLIRDLKEQGKTILFSTHILGDVQRICDRVGILSEGKIILEKPLQRLLQENILPVFDVVLHRDAKPFLDGLSRLGGVTAVRANGREIAITVDDADAVSVRLMSYFSTEKVPVISFRQRQKNLEDIFIEEVNHRA